MSSSDGSDGGCAATRMIASSCRQLQQSEDANCEHCGQIAGKEENATTKLSHHRQTLLGLLKHLFILALLTYLVAWVPSTSATTLLNKLLLPADAVQAINVSYLCCLPWSSLLLWLILLLAGFMYVAGVTERRHNPLHGRHGSSYKVLVRDICIRPLPQIQARNMHQCINFLLMWKFKLAGISKALRCWLRVVLDGSHLLHGRRRSLHAGLSLEARPQRDPSIHTSSRPPLNNNPS